MGAFHEGHLELMRRSVRECEQTAISIFVNPLQFGQNEDLSRYPRREVEDLVLAEQVGVDLAFCPTVEELIGSSITRVTVGKVTDRWEGARRLGHFEGVATIVCKLFNIVQPNVAYFGLKDYQQCAVVQAMTTDLNMDIDLRFVETFREADGLAMSSRNQYLNSSDRATAPLLYQTLRQIASALRQRSSVASAVLASGQRTLEEAGFTVDYLALVDGQTLEPITALMSNARLLCAAKLGNTWLIDNVEV